MSLDKSFAEKSFKDLSDSIKASDKVLIDARLLMYRFLSEIDKVTNERGINRKELAKLAGTSASYITQLYQGKKIINLQMLTRIKNALDIDFKIEVIRSGEKVEKDTHKSYSKKVVTSDLRSTVHVSGTHLPGKLIQVKSSKSERRSQKAF